MTDTPNPAMLAVAAWAAALKAVRQMPLLFISAAFLAILTKVVEIGAQTMPGVIPAAWGENWDYLAALSWTALSMFLKAAVLAPVAIAVHRLVLLQQTTRGLVAWMRSRTWRFVGWTLAITALSGALALPIYASDGSRWQGLACLVFGVCIVVVSVRSLLIFPAVAIEDSTAGWRERFETAWTGSGPHFWRLTFALAGALGLFLMPVALASIILTFVLGWLGYVDAMASVGWGAEFLFAGLSPFTIALAAAVASFVYRCVREQPASVALHGVVAVPASKG